MPEQIGQFQTNSNRTGESSTVRLPLTRFKVKELLGSGIARCHTITDNGEGELDYYVATYDAAVDSEIFAAKVEGNTGFFQDDFAIDWLGFFDGFLVTACDGTVRHQVRNVVLGVGFVTTFDPDFPNTAGIGLNLVPGLGIDVHYGACIEGIKISSLGIQVASPGGESPAPICNVHGIDFTFPERGSPTGDDSLGIDWTADTNWQDWDTEFTLTSTDLVSTCFHGDTITQVIVTAKLPLPKGYTGTRFRKTAFYDSTGAGKFMNHVEKETWVRGLLFSVEAMEDENIIGLSPCTTG